MLLLCKFHMCLTTFSYAPFFFCPKKTSLAGVEPAIFRSVVWRVSIAPQALLLLLLTHSFSLLPDDCHDYPILTLSLVGSYQVGYTRSHPNTEVKMLRACSVPLCSHRWERQVIYLFVFLLIYTNIYKHKYNHNTNIYKHNTFIVPTHLSIHYGDMLRRPHDFI